MRCAAHTGAGSRRTFIPAPACPSGTSFCFVAISSQPKHLWVTATKASVYRPSSSSQSDSRVPQWGQMLRW